MKMILDSCCNHLGNRYIIEKMIEEVGKYKGIIKFQLYDPEKLNPEFPNYLIRKKEYTDFQIRNDDLDFIFAACAVNNVIPMFTIFNETRLKDLLRFEFSDFYLKIASPDAMKLDFIRNVVKMYPDKELLISTGMVDKNQIQTLKDTFKKAKLLYCVSKYPTHPEDIDYYSLDNFKGFSDHSLGLEVIKFLIEYNYNLEYYERHFTLSRELPGRDQEISINPEELKRIFDILEHKKVIDTYSKRFQNG